MIIYEYKEEKFISGTITCNNCHMKIKWRYKFPLKEYGIYVGNYPTDIVFASKAEKYNDSDDMYCVRCRNCDRKNYFEYTME